jgi:hypothetical protein
MKMNIRITAMILIAVFAWTGLSAEKSVRKVAIETISNNPASFDNELVKVEGLVTQYIPANANSTAYYLIRGDYGSFIRINTTANPPETNQKYCVTGVVYVFFNENGSISKFFISEQSRYDGICQDFPEISVVPQTLDFGEIEPNKSSEMSFTISNIGRADLNLTEISISNNQNFEIIRPQTLVLEPGKSTVLKVIFTPKESGDYSGILNITSNATNSLGQIQVAGMTIPPPPHTNWLMYILIAAAVLLLVLLVVLFANRRKEKVLPKQDLAQQPQQPAVTQNTTYVNRTDYSTIAIPKTILVTQKLFPGEFEIISGVDIGKKFKIPGHQEPQGLVVTIGREDPGKTMSQYHIQLKDNTVGREQAQLIHNGNGTEFISLGKTNFSIVDGKELQPQEKAILVNGSTIKLGEVTLKYNL